MYGYIYKTTNLLNNKIYVGQKKSEKFLGDEYKGSGVALLNAIAKYGKDNFKTVLLETCSSKEELNEKEIFWIKELNCTLSDIGYNLIDGGNGGSITHNYIWINNGYKEKLVPFITQEHINEGFKQGRLLNNKSSIALSGRIWIHNGIEQHQIHLEDLPLYKGFVKGMLPRGNEWKEKLKNRKLSEQHISNLKQSIKKFHENNPHFRNEGMFKPGSTPLNKGKVSVTDGKVNRYVDLCEVTSLIAQGWRRGSTQKRTSKRSSTDA